ncbi:MAG TPA: type II toxin-antitoxin system VapC family toxin [Longimicrobiales bacterium]
MIYVDTSVVLAQLFAEDRIPPAALWRESLVSSRLLEYELWTRMRARRVPAQGVDAARDLLGRIALLDLSRELVARVIEPFPAPLRTLDALHLASAHFLAGQGIDVRIATYDERMVTAAKAMGFELYSV